MVNPFLTDQPVTDYRSSASADDELMNRIFLALLVKGYHTGRGAMSLVLSAPMESEHIDGLLEALEQVLEEGD